YSVDENRLAILQGEEKLSNLDDVLFDSTPACGVGHGWSIAPESWLKSDADIKVDSHLLPDARSLLKLARQAVAENHTVSAENTSINYLRNQVASKPRH
ncbi:MAG: hypothetical protein DRQ59_06120, partial [Gammaproteobacteria bacterium]